MRSRYWQHSRDGLARITVEDRVCLGSVSASRRRLSLSRSIVGAGGTPALPTAPQTYSTRYDIPHGSSRLGKTLQAARARGFGFGGCANTSSGRNPVGAEARLGARPCLPSRPECPLA